MYRPKFFLKIACTWQGVVHRLNCFVEEIYKCFRVEFTVILSIGKTSEKIVARALLYQCRNGIKMLKGLTIKAKDLIIGASTASYPITTRASASWIWVAAMLECWFDARKL